MFEEASAQDILLIALLMAGMAAVVIVPATLALRYFVALRSPPTIRAAWTAGVAYLIVTVLLVFGGPQDTAAFAPLVALPGTLLAFLFWRADFRRGWVDDEHVAEGVELANDDWATGLVRLAGLIVVAVIVTLARRYFRGEI